MAERRRSDHVSRRPGEGASRSGGPATARGWPPSTSAASPRRSAWPTCPTSRSATTTIVHVGFAIQSSTRRRPCDAGRFEDLACSRRSSAVAWARRPPQAGAERSHAGAGTTEDRASHEVPRRVPRPGAGPQPARRDRTRRPRGPGRSWRSAAARRTRSSATASTSCCPDEIELIHGPGCPVCVTPLEMIDKALAIAARPGRDLLLVRRHAARARQPTRPVPGARRRAATCASSTRRSTR